MMKWCLNALLHKYGDVLLTRVIGDGLRTRKAVKLVACEEGTANGEKFQVNIHRGIVEATNQRRLDIRENASK